MSLKLEKIEDLLEVDITTLKSADKSKLLNRLKALINLGDKIEVKTTEEAKKNLPYEGISVVNDKLITIKFDLDSKEARVTDVIEDSRPPVIGLMAINMVKKLTKEQK